MKKIIILLLPLFILCFSVKVYAATNAGSVQLNSASDVKNWYQNHGITCNDTVASALYNNYFSQYNNCLIFVDSSYGYYFVGDYTINGNTCTLGNATYSGYFQSGQALQGYNLSNQTISWATYFSEVDNIDFSNPYYDPLLPVPEVEIRYNTEDYSSGNVPVLPISIALTNADSAYYVEVVQVNYMPSTVAVKYQDYTAVMSHKFEQRNLIPAQMLKTSSTLSYDDLGDLAENAWSQDVVSYPVSNVVFTNQIGQDQGGVSAFNNMVDLYTNARRLGLFYGNNTEFYFRYFVIDSNNRFVVSAWRTWSSLYSNSFGLAMPSYYQTYSSASGYENTDSNTSVVISPTSQPNVVNPSNNHGKKTGGLINIQIGSNVPNYPDYPTIATYNTDNLLVNALDTAKQLPDFFTSSIAIFNGMFSGLLPEPFWGIIMTGFLFSIVIMIIKVL